MVRRVAGLLLVTRLAACDDERTPSSSAARLDTRGAEHQVTPPSNGVAVDGLTSLRDVVMSGALVGRRVQVAGRCVTKPPAAAFAFPGVASLAWQLEADGVTVFVLGPAPSKCAFASEAREVSITALVSEDTLPPIGDLPAAPRRYLVRVEIGRQ